MSANTVLIFNDLQAALLLKRKFQEQQVIRLHEMKIKELFNYLEAIQNRNLCYLPITEINFMEEAKTFVFCKSNCNIPKEWTAESISDSIQVLKRKKMLRNRLCYPDEHLEMMKKLEKLCETVGELKSFHHYEYYESHVGGYEYEINTFGVDGVFLLVFLSKASW